MGITHKWSGTTLIVTSDSGTSSCDLKGAKGDTGCRGAQGKTGFTIGADGLIDTSGFASTDYVDNAIANIGNDTSTGITEELKTALKTYFINIQELLPQLVYLTENHNGELLIANAQNIVNALDNVEQPTSGITQMGSILAITSGVTATKSGTVLAIS